VSKRKTKVEKSLVGQQIAGKRLGGARPSAGAASPVSDGEPGKSDALGCPVIPDTDASPFPAEQVSSFVII
jgi:hypothetical protein